jgi:hypothetical protein
MADDLAPLSFYERIARLEERMGSLIALLDEIRRDQRDLADTVARASGGMRMLLLLGGLAGLAGALHALSGWAASLVGRVPGGGA